MMDARRTRWAMAVAVALLAAPAGAAAQAGAECENGVLQADLGFARMIGGNVSIHISGRSDQRDVRYTFGAEPTIEGIHGPGAGRLQDGDVLVSVDGMGITTEEGGRRFSAMRPGERVRLGVRRGGRIQQVTVTAGEHCMPVPQPPRPPAAPQPPTTRLLGRPVMPGAPPVPPRVPFPQPAPAPAAPAPPPPPAPPAPPSISPEGWFGFGISCRDCGIHEADGRTTFQFGSPPSLMSVEPGTPAARAGLRRGDLLTHVDGVSITTPEGWRRFGDARPGQTVRLTYVRDGRSRTVPVQALRRPDVPADARQAAAAARAAEEQALRLRYAGVVAGSRVEVRGSPVTVTTDEATGETIIRSHDLVVRIRPERP